MSRSKQAAEIEARRGPLGDAVHALGSQQQAADAAP
jgi:hypothetical protein